MYVHIRTVPFVKLHIDFPFSHYNNSYMVVTMSIAIRIYYFSNVRSYLYAFGILLQINYQISYS